MSDTITRSILVTDDEQKTIREAAHAEHPRGAVAPWCGAKLAAAVSGRDTWARALADYATVGKGVTQARDRKCKVSITLPGDVYDALKVKVAQVHDTEINPHRVMQAIVISEAIRTLASRHPRADATRPVEPKVAAAIRSLEGVREGARGLPFERYVDASIRLRQALMRRGTIERGERDRRERELERLPAGARDVVMRVAGWTGLPPIAVYVAACAKAGEPDAQGRGPSDPVHGDGPIT